jgi:hypothetical protein
MSETVMSISALPEFLVKTIPTEKVRVQEIDGEIRLTPITNKKRGCPLRGLCADGKISSYSFMERKQAEKELEG